MSDLFNLWQIWLEGEKLDDYLLWGHSILFWGRIGKIIGLLSAMVIIVDIIGVEKLQAFGKSLHPVITREQTRRSFTSGIRWAQAIFDFLYARRVLSAVIRKKWHRPDVIAYWRDKVQQAEDRLDAFSEYRWYHPLAILLTVVITLLLSRYFSLTELLTELLGLVLAAWFLSSIIIVPLILAIFPLLLQLIALLFDVLIVEPMAFLLENQSLGTLVKVISLILLLIGFHFDLLAS